MQVLMAEHHGMCFGVRDAIELARNLTADGPVTIAIAILTDHGRAWRKHPGLWAISQVGTAPGTKYSGLPCNRQCPQQKQQTDADRNLPQRRRWAHGRGTHRPDLRILFAYFHPMSRGGGSVRVQGFWTSVRTPYSRATH